MCHRQDSYTSIKPERDLGYSSVYQSSSIWDIFRFIRITRIINFQSILKQTPLDYRGNNIATTISFLITPCEHPILPSRWMNRSLFISIKSVIWLRGQISQKLKTSWVRDKVFFLSAKPQVHVGSYMHPYFEAYFMNMESISHRP